MIKDVYSFKIKLFVHVGCFPFTHVHEVKHLPCQVVLHLQAKKKFHDEIKVMHLLENRCNTGIWLFSDRVEISIFKFPEYFYIGILSKQNQCKML